MPISFTLSGGNIDSWQWFGDLDDNPTTGYGWGHEIVVRTILSDAYVIRYTGQPAERDGWGVVLGRAPVNLPMTVTVHVPVGGSVAWRAEGYSMGALVSLTTGRATGGPFSVMDDAAAVWCITGPGVAPWVGC